MMTLDRRIAPPSKKVEHIYIPKSNYSLLANGCPLYTIRAGEQEVFRLELIFEAGITQEVVRNASYFTSKMLSEGTSKHNAEEISEFFDQYGAFLEISQSADRFSVMIYGLTEYLPNFLPLLKEMITDSVFPEKEFKIQKSMALQHLRVNTEKTAYVAAQMLRQQLYGENHPYGHSLTLESIEAISQKDVVEFYEKNIQHSPFKAFLSGKFGETEVEAIKEVLGTIPTDLSKVEHQLIEIPAQLQQNILIEKTQSLQSSIRLGRVMFNRTHPDLFKFLVTNTLLGGFFGSRLMKNIREDKGFTYGISSVLMPLRESGYFAIGTDVKKEFTEQTLQEIEKEIIRLQTEKVEEDELETTKNYMIGAFVGSLNTPFEIADRQKIVILDNLPVDFYEKYIERVRAVSAEDIMEMANKYLKINDLSEVVVGGK